MLKLGVAGILAFGREREQDSPPGSEAGRLQDRLHLVVRRARIGRGFEHHELAPAQTLGDLPCRVVDVRQVRLAMGAERRGDADQDRVALRQPSKSVVAPEAAAA